MVQTQIGCLLTDILPALKTEGISIAQWADLSSQEQKELEGRFHKSLEPLLTPLAVDPGHPFPFMSNMTLAIAVVRCQPALGQSCHTACARSGSPAQSPLIRVEDLDGVAQGQWSQFLELLSGGTLEQRANS